MQQRASAHIYRAKHNRAGRPIGAPRCRALHFSRKSAYNGYAMTVRGIYGKPCWSLGWRFVWR
jgi:hypothetical protein